MAISKRKKRENNTAGNNRCNYFIVTHFIIDYDVIMAIFIVQE